MKTFRAPFSRMSQKIYDHIAEDNPTAALDVARGIFAKIQLLRTFPRFGGRYMPIADREVREILYGHYRVPYLVVSEDRVEWKRRLCGAFQGFQQRPIFHKRNTTCPNSSPKPCPFQQSQ